MAWQTVDGETVLVRTELQEVLGLNDVGGRIWELVDGRRSIAQILETIASEHDLPASEVRADVLEFVAELLSLRILTLAQVVDSPQDVSAELNRQ